MTKHGYEPSQYLDEWGVRRFARKLGQYFDEIRETYFAAWTDGPNWSLYVMDEPPLGATGYCDDKTKRVLINSTGVRNMPDTGLRALIIHEICHGTGSPDHDDAWRQEMARCAEIADRLEPPHVASVLRADVRSYREAGPESPGRAD